MRADAVRTVANQRAFALIALVGACALWLGFTVLAVAKRTDNKVSAAAAASTTTATTAAVAVVANDAAAAATVPDPTTSALLAPAPLSPAGTPPVAATLTPGTTPTTMSAGSHAPAAPPSNGAPTPDASAETDPVAATSPPATAAPVTTASPPAAPQTNAPATTAAQTTAPETSAPPPPTTATPTSAPQTTAPAGAPTFHAYDFSGVATQIVIAQCPDNHIAFVSATPASGWRSHVQSSGPDTVVVTFRNPSTDAEAQFSVEHEGSILHVQKEQG